MKTFLIAPIALLAALSSSNRTAFAQPDTNNAPKAENPANRQPRQRLRPDANMTTEQRAKWFIKTQFSLLGADEAAQEAIASFIQNEIKAREELMKTSQPLQNALRARVIPDTQVAALLNDYHAALEDEKARRAQALSDLEKIVDWKKSPKIEAALTLGGFIGDGPMINLGGAVGRGLTGGIGLGGRGQLWRGNRPNQEERNNRDNRPRGNNPNVPPAQGV